MNSSRTRQDNEKRLEGLFSNNTWLGLKVGQRFFHDTVPLYKYIAKIAMFIGFINNGHLDEMLKCL